VNGTVGIPGVHADAGEDVKFKNEDEAVNARVRDQLLVVRNAAEQLRAALLATAEDPAEPHLARAAHDEQVEAARAQLARLVRWRPRRHWRTAAVVRRWPNYAVLALFYRIEPYQAAEQALWAAITRLPDTTVTASARRRLREQVEDAQVLADYALLDRRAIVLRSADAHHAARRRGDPNLVAAAAWTALAAPPPVTDTDPGAWPVTNRSELRNRVEQDRLDIRLGVVFGGDRRYRSAQRQLEPWLEQLSDTLTSPLSAAALELACDQWRERRAPYLTSHQHAQVRVGSATRPG
jgi:hypothetical protein